MTSLLANSIAPAAVICSTIFAAGCAVGRTSTGSTVLGIDVHDPMPENISELAHLATSVLPFPWDLVTGGAATLLLGGLAGHRRGIAHQQSDQLKIDHAWDEAHSRANT